MTVVYIPTRGRVGNQPSYNSLVATGIETILVCPPDEEALHRDLGYAVVPCPAEGISATRQWIMDQDWIPNKVMMFDDDLRFAVRRLDDRNKFLPAEVTDVKTMLDRMELMLDQVPMVGLCNRGGANNTPVKDVPVAMNKRMFDVQCFDTAWFRKNNIRYRTPLMEDFDITLQALTQGFPNALLTTHTKDNIGAANAGGGCSTYRTMAGQAEAALWLAQKWPAFVQVREVLAKSQNEWGTRIDVLIQWVQAFNAGTVIRDWPTPDWSDLAPEWSVL